MERERWKAVEELYHAAREIEPSGRASYLAEACRGDELLLREVESLLAEDSQASSFLGGRAVDDLARELASGASTPDSSPPEEDLSGRRLSHYQVLDWVAAGGTGVVYRARDTRLRRIVAIKVLSRGSTGNRERLRRLRSEARAASALNHPNIVTIYDIDEGEGVHFIAMEYVSGRTLRDSIPPGGMPALEVLGYGIQAADALARAHEAGIIHRDLKPSNIMVDSHGLVKVLDFGLAKLREPVPPSGKELSPSVITLTEAGAIFGTPAYMSPEQAEGKPIDARSDIFSLGAVLYEMITGRRIFHRDSPKSTLAAVIEEEPKRPSELSREIPQGLEQIILHCLRKDPEQRPPTMGDLKGALEDIRRSLDSAAGGAGGHRHGGIWARVMLPAALLVSMVGLVLWRSGWLLKPEHAPAPRIIPFTSFPGREMFPAFSPDGQRIAFVWTGENEDNADIYVKAVGGDQTPLRLTSDPAADGYPAWSPDGRRIAYIRFGRPRPTVCVKPALGGEERVLAMTGAVGAGLSWSPGGGLSWSPDGRLLSLSSASSQSGIPAIVLLSVATGEVRQLTVPPAGSGGDYLPVFSPDGRHVAFDRMPIFNTVEGDLYVQSIGPEGAPLGNPKRITFERSEIQGLDWSPDGKSLIFSANRDAARRLWRLALPSFSSGEGDVKKPEPLSVGSDEAAEPSVARMGHRIAWVRRQTPDVDLWKVDRSDPASKAGPARLAYSTRVEDSPHFAIDGKSIAFISDRSGRREVWTCDNQGENPRQLTSFEGRGDVGTPRWSPDAREIVFDSTSEGQRDVYVVSAQAGEARRITSEKSQDVRPSWSRDGKWIYFGSNRSGSWQIWKVSPSGGTAVQVTKRGGREAFESFDGRTVYYTKQAGVPGIWKIPADGGEETLVVNKGGQTYWALARSGFFFIQSDSAPLRIQFFNLATSRLELAAVLPPETYLTGNPSIAVSPDERSVLYAAYTRRESDILMAENFR